MDDRLPKNDKFTFRIMDINCDAGESYGHWCIGDEANLFRWVRSVNIACGFHAGDPSHIQQTILLAKQHKLRIGAHPGYPDLVGFGRRSLVMSFSDIESMVMYQVAALKGMVEGNGSQLTHVKPHGALYTDSAVNPNIAQAIASAIYKISPELILVGLAGSISLEIAQEKGLVTLAEVFADRSYESTGQLTSRSIEGSVLSEEQEIRNQVQAFLGSKPIRSRTGEFIELKGQTICVHGDSHQAVQIAQWVWEEVHAVSPI